MAQVPTYGPGQQVQPTAGFTPLQVPQGIVQDPLQLNWRVVGAALRQPAEALASAGQGLQRLGANVSDIMRQQALEDSTHAARQADVQFSAAIRGITGLDGSGNGLYSMHGDNAVNGYQGAADQIQAARQKITDGLTSPRARELFGQMADQRQQSELNTMGRFVLGQRTAAANGASSARIQNAVDDATARWNDPAALAQSADIIRGEVVSTGQRNGWAPEQVQAATTQALSGLYGDVIRTTAANNPQAGGALFQKLAPALDAKTRVELAQTLKPKIIGAQADAIAGAAFSGATAQPSTGGFEDNVRVESGGHQFVPGTDTPLESQPGQPDSPVGAAQIKPSTAQETAQKHGITFDAQRLRTDKAYNLQLGSLYHADLVDRYSGNKMLADAAYNAGPANVDQWLASKGDPRTGAITNTQFAASIPFDETRKYVEKVGDTARLAQPMQHPDETAAVNQVLAATGTDPELRQAALSRLSQKFTLYNLQTASDREDLQRHLDDIAAQLRSGDDTAVIPETRIRQDYAPAVAEDALGKLREAQFAGRIFKQVQFASPDDLVRLRTTLAGDQNADGQLALRQRDLASFDAMTKTRQEALAKDPASYVMAEPTVKAAFATIDPSNPATFQVAVQRSLDAQRHLGVQEPDLRVLTNAEVQQDVKQLHSVDPEKGDMGAQLDALATKYGAAWPQAFSDLVRVGKLDPAYQTLAVMDTPEQASGRANLQRALQMKAQLKDKFNDGVPFADRQALPQAIETTLGDFQRTTQFGGQGLFAGTIKPAVTDLATYYAASGTPPADAAARAYNDIIGLKYDVVDTFRAPKGLGAQVQASGDTLVAGLKDGDLRGITAAEARRGVWANTPDGGGVALMAPTAQGGYRPVRRSDGSLVTMQFNHLPAAVATVDPYLATNSLVGGQ